MCSLSTMMLSAMCILVVSRIAFATDLLTCNTPSNFTVEINGHKRAFLYETELTVQLEKDSLTVVSHPGINSINIRANNVIVTFKGFMKLEDNRILYQPERISQFYVDRISGIGQRVILNSTDLSVHDCRLVLLPTETDRSNEIPLRISNEIRRLAESCVELDVCQRVGQMKSEQLVKSPIQSSRPGLLALYTDPLLDTQNQLTNSDTEGSDGRFSQGMVQSAINKLVDIALAEIIEKLRKKNEGTIDVPNVDKQFTTGAGIFKTTGRFEATNGTFRDLTTIRRITDATLDHEGMKFIASCGFGLKLANLKFDHYKLKYGIIKVHGQITGKIDGVALQATVAADYNQTPCAMELLELTVTEFGKMDIHVTGLVIRPLNFLLSSILNWVSDQWQGKIVKNLEKRLRRTIQRKLATFDCERFRP